MNTEPAIVPQDIPPIFSDKAGGVEDPAAGLFARSDTPCLWDLFLVFLLVVATDIALLQQSTGFAGWGAWGALACLFLAFGIGRRRVESWRGSLSWVLIGTISISMARLIWQGDWLIVLSLILQLILLAITMHGLPLKGLPFVGFLVGLIPGGFFALPGAVYSLSGCASLKVRRRYLEWGVPSVVGLVFVAIFLKANPDSFVQFWEWMMGYFDAAALWFRHVTFARFFFWGILSLLGFGALLPGLLPDLSSESTRTIDCSFAVLGLKSVSDGFDSYYATFRNTLVLLIGIFGVYLYIEFSSMWFREFPEGFYYSGYAHQGAAWLTFALALTTIVLSIVFSSGSYTSYQTLPTGLRRLRMLGSIWFSQNLLLALCVYNRMFVYIGFNGMTRLRILALLGITCVIVGLVLLLFRIYQGWRFADLVYRQFWTMMGFLFVYIVLPTDAIVYRYNTRCIDEFNSRPSVQIMAHKISPSGVMELIPLVDTIDETVREGVRAFLAEELAQFNEPSRIVDRNWRTYQHAETVLRKRLGEIAQDKLSLYIADDRLRQQTLERFYSYVMQWY